jgi:AcrR family transcriptional regulator
VALLLESPPVPLTATPWGPAELLRAQRLAPGLRERPAAVGRSQRARIYGATVAVVAEHGYDASSIADILRLAGVSRRSFYEHFDDKLDCFLATLDVLAELAIPRLAEAYGASRGASRERLGAVFESAAAMVVAQPAASRVWLIEAHAAGPLAVERIERLADDVNGLACTALADMPGRALMPAAAVRAVLGGVGRIVRARLRDGRERELPALEPELLDWALGYSAPPSPLRASPLPPLLPPPTQEADDRRRRILAAVTDLVADAGYQGLTTRQVARRAAVSLTTFYRHFEGTHAAFVAAVDDAWRQLDEVVLSAYRRDPDWPCATRDAVHALFAFSATRPMIARLGGMRIFSGGARGFERHDEAVFRFGGLLEEGFRRHPGVHSIAGEAISGTVCALIYQQIRRDGPERLYEAAGIATYLTLSPFVGAEAACELANEGWPGLVGDAL